MGTEDLQHRKRRRIEEDYPTFQEITSGERSTRFESSPSTHRRGTISKVSKHLYTCQSRLIAFIAKALSPDANITGTSNAEIHPSGQVLNLTLSSLLSFLQQYQANDVNLEMRCPYIGVPLPSIEIGLGSTLGLSGTLQFSLRLSELLIQYMLEPRMPEQNVPGRHCS